MSPDNVALPNVITGQNNSGKTALLEALSLHFSDKPHRSVSTIPTPHAIPYQKSEVEVVLNASSEEVKDILIVPGNQLIVPMPDLGSLGTDIGVKDASETSMRLLLQWVLAHEILRFRLQIGGGNLVVSDFPSFGLYLPERNAQPRSCAAFVVEPDGKLAYQGVRTYSAEQLDFGNFVISRILSRIYVFKAERLSIGLCAVGPNPILRSDASNLAEVLANLQSNLVRFRRFNQAVQEILPDITQISVRNVNANQVEILVWHADPELEREDLAVPLTECGTGIGQVLAILYVALNSIGSQIILIDEPQSFLHPGAVRKLIEVLRQHKEHQYILTSHSPTVIQTLGASTITLIRQHAGESSFQAIDPSENEQMQEYLSEIGARLSDVFGADNILWVEGPTEEICFPIILREVAKRSLMGTAIIGVKHTGDLEGRHKRTVFEIYDRLSKGTGLLPPAVAFIFDREGRNQNERDDICRTSKNLVKFLPRRLYENYLLHSDAIAAITNDIVGFRAEPVMPEEVQTWVDSNRSGGKYVLGSVGESKSWHISIHGAKLLTDLFAQLSEGRVEYDKVTHSVALTRWLVQHEPLHLEEIALFITSAIDRLPVPNDHAL